MIYHLLGEPFSAQTGLALSIAAANMMRFDQTSVVVCPRADDTWGFDKERVLVIPRSAILAAEIRGSSMRGWRFVPLSLSRQAICAIFGHMLSRLKESDIVWCHNWPYVAQALERDIHRKGAKLIYHAHNSLAPYARRRLFSHFAPDAYVFNSDAMRQEAVRLMPYLKHTHVVHNGANEDLFYPPNAESVGTRDIPVILYVGRLVPIKGVHVLIEAMRRLHERKVQALCKIVGSSHSGGNRNKHTSYIQSLYDRRPPGVQFEGFRSARYIAQEYRAADIFCCPSTWNEPFGLVNIEAMATGIPVVASRVGGIPEIAADGGILLVEPGSVAALADALQMLIENTELRARIGTEGRASFQRRFTAGAIAKLYFQIAGDVLNDNRSPDNSVLCDTNTVDR